MDNFVLGALAALVSAACWAMGSVLWRKVGGNLSAFSMNLLKGIIGSIYLVAVLAFLGADEVTGRSVFYLVVSGVVGISIGDTCFFAALLNIGPRLTCLLGTLTPVATALVAILLLGEQTSPVLWSGIVMTCGGVAWVLSTKNYSEHIVRDKWKGLLFGILSVLCTVVGIILAKKALDEISAIQASFIRMLAGTLGLAAWGLATGAISGWIQPLRNPKTVRDVAFIMVLGTFGGFFLSLYALKWIDASVSASLNSTSPLFVIPFAALLLKERVGKHSVLGACVAVGGVALIFAAR